MTHNALLFQGISPVNRLLCGRIALRRWPPASRRALFRALFLLNAIAAALTARHLLVSGAVLFVLAGAG